MLKKNNIDTVVKVLKNYLTDTIKYYEENTYTNKDLTFQISEIVREKVFNLTDEEVPHSLTCITENIEKAANANHIRWTKLYEDGRDAASMLQFLSDRVGFLKSLWIDHT